MGSALMVASFSRVEMNQNSQSVVSEIVNTYGEFYCICDGYTQSTENQGKNGVSSCGNCSSLVGTSKCWLLQRTVAVK